MHIVSLIKWYWLIDLDGVWFAKDVFSNRYSEHFAHVGAAELGWSVREKIGQDIGGAGLVSSV